MRGKSEIKAERNRGKERDERGYTDGERERKEERETGRE